MKTLENKHTFVKGLGLIENPEQNPLLHHFLSPLELAVFKNHFQSFSYDFDGELLDIETSMCRELFSHIKNNIEFKSQILQHAKQRFLMRDARIKRFLTMPLQNHNLPTRLYNVLHFNNCISMSQAAAMGLYGLKQMRGMGKTQLNCLLRVFKDNGCISLIL